MIDLHRYPKIASVLEAHGVALVEGKPLLTEAWRGACAPHLRGLKREHKERQEAVRRFGEQSADAETMAFLGWVLLTDSWRHVRAEAVQVLAGQATEQSQALIALALADRSQLVVRAARKALAKQGGLPAFLVLVAIWEEDKWGQLDGLHGALVGLARRAPHSAMRQVLPRLEQEARKLFILPVRRRRLRELIVVLDTATAHLKDLPLTAMASVEATNLPLPTTLSQPSLAVRESTGWVQRIQRWFKS